MTHTFLNILTWFGFNPQPEPPPKEWYGGY